MNKKGKKIVVAEDDPGIIEVVKIILEDEGHAVFIAPTKPEVLALVDKQSPDIIFLDIMLAGATGKDIASTLKQNPKTSHIPIVLLSANSDLKEIAKKAKVTDHLQKPFEISELLDMVAKHTK